MILRPVDDDAPSQFSKARELLSQLIGLPEIAEVLDEECYSAKRVYTQAPTLWLLVLQRIGGGLSLEAAVVELLKHHRDLLPPNRRVEVLVAAMLRSFASIWSWRLSLLANDGGRPDRQRTVEVGADAAECLLTAAIRAIDYTPPVDLQFGDFLSALLTADYELNPADNFRVRRNLVYHFSTYGIEPASTEGIKERLGMWGKPPSDLNYSSLNRDTLVSDTNEVFRFLWENRKSLKIYATHFYVQSVRPSLRIGEDGMTVRETVAEYVQVLTIRADELKDLGLRKPSDCPADERVRLYGGGALVFDDFGKLRFHIRNRLDSPEQQARLNYVWRTKGQLDGKAVTNFCEFHAARGVGGERAARRKW